MFRPDPSKLSSPTLHSGRIIVGQEACWAVNSDRLAEPYQHCRLPADREVSGVTPERGRHVMLTPRLSAPVGYRTVRDFRSGLVSPERLGWSALSGSADH